MDEDASAALLAIGLPADLLDIRTGIGAVDVAFVTRTGRPSLMGFVREADAVTGGTGGTRVVPAARPWTATGPMPPIHPTAARCISDEAGELLESGTAR